MAVELNSKGEGGVDFLANLDAWRFILISMVVINHSLAFVEMTGGPPEVGTVENIAVAVTRSSVPTLSMFSGYLFDRGQEASALRVITKKAASLILPFLFWNALIYAVFLGINDLLSIVPEEVTSNQSRYSIVNGLTSFHSFPANLPLYFLRDLFICFVLFCALARFLGNPVVFLALAAVLVMNFRLNIDRSIFIKDTIPIFFLLGIGLHRFPLFRDTLARATLPLASSAVLVLCACIVDGTSVRTFGNLTVCFVLSLFIVSLSMTLRTSRLLSVYGRRFSYIVFLSHWWILLLLSLVWERLDLPAWSFAALSAPPAILAGIAIAKTLSYLPSSMGSLICGARIGQVIRAG